MNILSFSSCFPSSADPTRGIFVLRRLAAMARHARLEVVHPVGAFLGYRSARAPRGGREEFGGLTVHHVPFFYIPRFLKHLDAGFYARGVGRWLARHMAAHGVPDVLDVHFSWPDGAAMGLLAPRLGLPYVVTLRGVLNLRLHSPAMRRRVVDSLRRADAVISVSDDIADRAVREGVPRQAITVIPNGVDTEMFRPLPREQARQALGLDPAGRYVVCVSGIRPNKGLTDLVEAMANLDNDVRLVIVGESARERGHLRELQDRAQALGCRSRLIFTDAQPHERVAQYLCAGDVSVLASYTEGCPNVVLESLACGVPVVATAVGHVDRIIVPRENGLLVPVKDPAALAAALRDALGRPWSPQAIRTSPAVVSWDAVARKALTVLEGALARRRGGSPERASRPPERLSEMASP